MNPPMTRAELEGDILLDAEDYRDMARWLMWWADLLHCDAQGPCEKCPAFPCGEVGLRNWLEGE